MALLPRAAPRAARRQPALPGAALSLRRRHASARRCASSARSATSTGWSPRALPDARRWLDHGRWGVRHPLGARRPAPAAGDRLCVSRRRGPAAAPDPRRARACRHHRARPFPLHRQRRDGRAARGAAGLCAQGHRGLMIGRRSLDEAAKLAGRVSGDSTVAYAIAFARAVEAALGIEAPPRAHLAARADGRARAARQSFRRHRRHLQRCLLLADARPLRRAARARAARRRRLLRPPADDGPRGAGRRRRRSRARGRAGVADALHPHIRRRFPELVELYDNTASLQDRTVTHRHPEARSWRASTAPAAMSAAPRAALSMPAARRAIAPYDDLSFEVPVRRKAMSTRASGSASTRSSRASH